MSMWTLKKCCCCVDLRLGSFLIAYSMLVLRVGVLVTTCLHLYQENGMLHQGIHSIAIRDIAFHRLITVISLMILVFEILLCIALIVGLARRLDQHIQMYYIGSFAFLVLGLFFYAFVLVRYSARLGGWTWLVVAVEICMKMILIYFLAVIRSYYYKMREEIKDDEQRLDGKSKSSVFGRTNPGLVISSKP